MKLIDADALLERRIEVIDEVGTVLDVVETDEVEIAHPVNAIIIPDGATNGDVIKMMFPDMGCTRVNPDSEDSDWIIHTQSPYPWRFEDKARFSGDWWSSPYVKE